MKNKNLILAVILGTLVVGVGIAYFLIGKETLTGEPAKTAAVLEKADFSINIPEGWREATSVPGTSAIVVNIGEEITDPAAQKINFRSYFSVAYGTLDGKSKEDFIQEIKDGLRQLDSNTVITSENLGSIGGQDAHFIEAELSQQEVDFKVLIVLVQGKSGNDAWIMPFNTTKNNWDGNKKLFYQTAESFRVK